MTNKVDSLEMLRNGMYDMLQLDVRFRGLCYAPLLEYVHFTFHSFLFRILMLAFKFSFF